MLATCVANMEMKKVEIGNVELRSGSWSDPSRWFVGLNYHACSLLLGESVCPMKTSPIMHVAELGANTSGTQNNWTEMKRMPRI